MLKIGQCIKVLRDGAYGCSEISGAVLWVVDVQEELMLTTVSEACQRVLKGNGPSTWRFAFDAAEKGFIELIHPDDVALASTEPMTRRDVIACSVASGLAGHFGGPLTKDKSKYWAEKAVMLTAALMRELDKRNRI